MKAILILIISQLIISTTSFACSCLPISSSREARISSSHIFSGVVTEKVKYTSKTPAGNEIKEILITFRVHQIWKGEKTEVIQIRTPFSGDICGLDLKTGKKYLVYAAGGKIPVSNKCSRTRPHFERQAQEDVHYLGDAKHTIIKR